jgi:MFS transporter, DHA1 family, inner membrane transport protein
MALAGKITKPTAHAKNAAAGNLATGLSAWLGGVAFCAGFGITAPAWVAGPLTVLSVGISVLYMTAGRRGRAAASNAR